MAADFGASPRGFLSKGSLSSGSLLFFSLPRVSRSGLGVGSAFTGGSLFPLGFFSKSLSFLLGLLLLSGASLLPLASSGHSLAIGVFCSASPRLGLTEVSLVFLLWDLVLGVGGLSPVSSSFPPRSGVVLPLVFLTLPFSWGSSFFPGLFLSVPRE